MSHFFIIWWLSFNILFSNLSLGKTVLTFSLSFQCHGRNIWSCFNFCSVLGNFFFSYFFHLPKCFYAFFLHSDDLRFVRKGLAGSFSHQFKLECGESTLLLHILGCFLNANVFITYFKLKLSFQPFWFPLQEFSVFKLVVSDGCLASSCSSFLSPYLFQLTLNTQFSFKSWVQFPLQSSLLFTTHEVDI